MYWSMVLQQFIIIVTMSYITNTFACFSSGFCPCLTTIASCSCTQRASLQPKSYVSPPVPHQLPSLLVPPSPSYPSAPHPAYPPYQPVPPLRIPYAQRYNFPYTYNALQTLPAQSVVPLYNNQRPPDNIIGTSENNNPYSRIYGIHSQGMLPNAVAQVPSIYESKNYPAKYGESLKQIEVPPSIISSELVNDVNQLTTYHLQHTDNPTDRTLPAQNIVIVSSQAHFTTAPVNLAQTTAAIPETNTNAGINDSNHQRATLLQRHISIHQNDDLVRRLDNSRKHQKGLLPLCPRNINESGNNQKFPSITGGMQSNNECIPLLTSQISSVSNDEFKNYERNNTRKEEHVLNDKQFETDMNLNLRKINLPNVRNGIRMISQSESAKHLKFSDAASIIDNHAPIVLRANNHDSNQLLQVYRNSKIGESISQKGRDINLIGKEKFISQNRNAIFGKPTFKEISSSGWTRKNDKLLGRTLERKKGLNNATKSVDYESSFYTTYHHQTCTGQILGHLRNGTIMSAAQKCEELHCDATNVRLSGDHVLEITFLKNITGRYRNYGNYCVSKKSIGQILSGRVTFDANTLSQARRFYDSMPKSNSYHEYREANRRERQTVRSAKSILIDRTSKIL